MELVAFAMEVLQSAAEFVASYRVGQIVIRKIDHVLWVIEKTARWAVPPPIDQDERPPADLIRPLPWVFFLGLLLTLRIFRESVSLFNLVVGKPPFRSADMVMFLQGKRRFLRALKYQGNRNMRARTSAPSNGNLFTNVRALFEFTMCFKRQIHNSANNNISVHGINDQVLVIKGQKKPRDETIANANSMDRLEKMLVDMDADSDDSSLTLNTTSSMNNEPDKSNEYIESNQESSAATVEIENTEIAQNQSTVENNTPDNTTPAEDSETKAVGDKIVSNSEENLDGYVEVTPVSTKDEVENFILQEKCSPQRAITTPKKIEKLANGQAIPAVPSNKKESPTERRDTYAHVASDTNNVHYKTEEGSYSHASSEHLPKMRNKGNVQAKAKADRASSKTKESKLKKSIWKKI